MGICLGRLPLQHLLDCHASNLQAELGILFKQVTRSAAERASVGRSSLSEVERQIQEPGILRGSKPTTAVTQFSRAQQNLLRIAGGVFPGDHPVGGKLCRGHVGRQGILLVRFGLPGGVKQYPFAGGVEGRIGLIQPTRGFGACQGLFDLAFGEERLHSELTVEPVWKVPQRQHIEEFFIAASREQARQAH